MSTIDLAASPGDLRSLAEQSNAWPFEQAKAIVARLKKTPKDEVLFETGYGPSGLPHIGTFGEVVRTTMVRQAFRRMSDLPTRLFAFSDDMDGLRKVPDNVPNAEMLRQHLGQPLTRIPDGVTDEEAAALPTPAITVLRTMELLSVTAGQRLVVMGATGGVGGYAVKMALSRGAHVIATVRGDADEARRVGAEEVYDTQAVEVADALCAAHPDGVDAVLDLVSGPDAIRGDAEFIKPGGRLVSTIFAADEEWFAERQITAHNSASSANPLLSPQGLTEVARMLADGTITARIRSTVELTGAGQMLDKLRKGGLRGGAVIRL